MRYSEKRVFMYFVTIISMEIIDLNAFIQNLMKIYLKPRTEASSK